jgi:hypothetical protein
MASAAASSSRRHPSSHALARADHGGRVLPGALGIEGDLARPVEAGEPLAQRLAGRQVADADHRVGAVGDGEALGAQQVVVVGDGGGAAPGAGERIGQQRRAEGGRGGRQRGGEAVVALVATGDDDRALPDLELDRRGRRAAARAREGLVAGRRQRLVEHERLAQREVQVHGARTPGHGRLVGAEGELAHPAQPLGRGAVRADLEEPLRRAAVELELVDGLPGPDLAQLGRAIGGEHDQRDARLVGLDHRGEVVGGRGAAGARHRRRAPALLAHAEGEEAGHALVDVRPRPQAGLAREGEHERGGA